MASNSMRYSNSKLIQNVANCRKIDYFSQLVPFERTENGMGLGSPVPINNFQDSSRVSRKM
jgi:hypothetical protein